MRVLFATRRVHLPHKGGGAQQSVHALLQLVQARGHGVEAAAVLPPGIEFNFYRVLRRLSGRRVSSWRDTRNGYATWRAPETIIPSVVEQRLSTARPDVVLTDFFPPNDIAALAVRQGIPTLLRMVDVTFSMEGTPIPTDPLIVPYGNSAFVAARVAAVTGRAASVIHPIVHVDRYRVRHEGERYVTLINPMPLKGVDTALAIARLLPQRRFLFVESWPLSTRRRADLSARLEDTPNVTLQPWTPDIRRVYGRTFILIVPSQIEEAFGRVALEAQASGIPVVARAIGGLPETVGTGGVLLPRDDSPSRWAEVIERLFMDPAYYQEISRAAEANVKRADLSPEWITDRFLELASTHVAAMSPLPGC